MSLIPDQHMLADPSAVNGTSHPQAHSALYAIPSGPLNVGVNMSVPVGGLPMHFPVQDHVGAVSAFTDGGHVLGGAGAAGTQQLDSNSPDLFKHNIGVAYQNVLRIQQTAQSAIAAIERAYQANGNQAMQASAEIVSLKHMLDDFADFLRESGVGSLPLMLPPPPPPPPTSEAQSGESGTAEMVSTTGTGLGLPTEQAMIDSTANAVKMLYEKRQRMQDNAASVSSLLGSLVTNDGSGTTTGSVTVGPASIGVGTPDERGRRAAG